MEKKRKIVMAAEMLRDCYGFVENKSWGCVSGFKFTIDDDGEGISVFSSDISADVFYYPEGVMRVVTGLELCCHVSLGRPYGREHREQIVFHIH